MQISQYPVKRISYTSMDVAGLACVARNSGGIASQAWRAAKRVLYIPFELPDRYYIAKLGWVNAGTVSGNVDAGIMDHAGTRIYHVGTGTAQSGANTIQSSAPNIWLPGGSYYFAISLDNTTGQLRVNNSNFSTTVCREAGVLQEDTGTFGIPTSFTPVAVTNPDIPQMFVADNTSLTF